MTWVQWLAQYYAIMQQREQEAKAKATNTRVSLKLLRDMLIWMFGLDTNMMTAKQDEEERDQDGFRLPPSITPLAWMTGHPEVLKVIFEQVKERAIAEEVKAGVEAGVGPDASFDRFSEQLLKQVTTGSSELQGDMIPMLTGDLKELLKDRDPWLSGSIQQQLAMLNIKPRPQTAPSAPAVTSRPKAMPPMRVLDEEYLRMAGELPFSAEEKERMVAALEEARKHKRDQKMQPGKAQRPVISEPATPAPEPEEDPTPSFGRIREPVKDAPKTPGFGSMPKEEKK
jgi:hypothetical protein